MQRHEPTWRRSLRRVGAKRVQFCGIALLVLLAGCAHERVVVRSECPEPTPAEAQDLSDWLLEDPERPAQVWAARVVGRLYPEDLDDLRGGDSTAEDAWGWIMPPWWGGDE